VEEKIHLAEEKPKINGVFGGSLPFLINAIDAVNNDPLVISNIYCNFAANLGEWNVFSP